MRSLPRAELVLVHAELFCIPISFFAPHIQVKFSSNQDTITSMASMANEVVELGQGVQVTDSIETWLSNLAQ